MFEPKFQMTDKIRGNIEDIDRNSWLIDNMLIMAKHEAWFRREVSIERATGTTTIEEVGMDEEAVRDLAKRDHVVIDSDNERANLNALRAYEFIDYLSDQPDISINELVIRELNRQFLRGAPEILTPGVYRKGQNKVSNYDPPNQGDIPDLMREFSSWLEVGEVNNEMHSILRSGIAHIHFAAIHPFWDGNGRVARGLTTLVLQRSRFSFRKLLSLEKFMADQKDDYFGAIERTLGTEFKADYDATPWLEWFTFALWVHSQILADKLTDWHRMMEGSNKLMVEVGLHSRMAEPLAFVSRTGQITRADYIEIAGVSPETASRDLARLVSKDLLVAHGATRSRVYRLSPAFEEGLRKYYEAEPS
jgi:Fic family protein